MVRIHATPRLSRLRNRAVGFTLVEVLIAVLVLALGLLGMATLQMVSLKNNSSAALRTQAVLLGQDIADRMRANPQGVAAGSYDAVPNCPSACTIASGCSPVQLAAYDICAWQDEIHTLLPGPPRATVVRGELVKVPDAASDIYQARIMWDDRQTGATGNGCDPDDPDDLFCFDVQFRP